MALVVRLLVVGFIMLFPTYLLAGSCSKEPRDDIQSCLHNLSEYAEKLESYRSDFEARNETALLELAGYFRERKESDIYCVASLSSWVPSELLATYFNDVIFITSDIERYVRLKSEGFGRETEEQMYGYVERRYVDLKKSIGSVINHELAFIPCDQRGLPH
ncbi:hypothetical protein [Marinobacter sp. LN3S78]|uniref:hypothetical protein n=1 Tax=Marinobacter sp. LN3S78 TaxID=3382300 RepID=UPI00387B304C